MYNILPITGVTYLDRYKSQCCKYIQHQLAQTTRGVQVIVRCGIIYKQVCNTYKLSDLEPTYVTFKD